MSYLGRRISVDSGPPMAVTRAAAAVAAALFLLACGLNTYGLTASSSGTSAVTDGSGLTDGSTIATTMSDSSMMPTGEPPPEASTLQLGFSQIKQFDFTWSAAAGAAYYQLLERLPEQVDYAQVGDDIGEASNSLTMPLHFRLGASYILRACNAGGCTDSEPLDVVDSMADAVGYFKASNSQATDHFGARVVLSGDGNTMVVGAALEDSGSPGDQADGSASDAGAAYVFVRENDVWLQQAYLKAFAPGAGDYFGATLAVSADGNTLAVGAYKEDSDANTIDGDQNNDDAADSGAVYVFGRIDGAWSQRAYLKADNADVEDNFGGSVAISADGNTLAVGVAFEDSNGSKADNSITDAGAVYVFVRAQNDTWSNEAYLKASNAGTQDYFGNSVALSADGNTLAVGAPLENSDAGQVGGDQADDSADNAGAVYVFGRSNGNWSQREYLKALNSDANDRFGIAVAISGDGDTIAVGAYGELSKATGIGGDQADNSLLNAGAAYVFVWANKAWSQQAYIKASNTGENDQFGDAIAVSADGNTLAVGAYREASTAKGVGQDQVLNTAPNAGAAYVFVRSENKDWSQRAYLKASNSRAQDLFGCSLAMSADGNTLAIGAYLEDSASIGVGGEQPDLAAPAAGAVYLY